MKPRTSLPILLAWALAAMNGLAQPVVDASTPADQLVIAGSNATFCVTATGTPPLTYQWRHNPTATTATNIPNETNACLVLTNVQATMNARRYSVVVCDSSVCVTSRMAKLTVNVPPYFTVEPTDQVIAFGTPYTNTVVALGNSPLSYQWYFVSGGATNALAGQVSATLYLPAVYSTNSGGYFVTVTNPVGKSSSRTASLQVLVVPPSILVQPVDATLEVGDSYSNQVVATGSPPLSYQWSFNGEVLPGKTNSQLIIPNIQLTNAGPYSVTVTSPYGTTNSRVASLGVVDARFSFTKVTEGPVVTDVVTNYSACWGDFDGDGLLDLAVVGAQNPGTNTQVYHNEGNGQFARSTDAVFNVPSTGIYSVWSDLENDGDLDLFMVGMRELFVYRNHGEGQFTREPAPVDIPVTGDTISWADYDGDGFLDAFLGVWMGWDAPGSRSALLHNRGDGTFNAVTDQPMCLVDIREESNAWVDYDNDGDLDLFAARPSNVTGPCMIYRNDGNGQFVEATPEPLRSELGRRIGAAWGDFDNDGDLDLFAPAWSTNLGRLYVNEGQGTFVHWRGQPASLTNNITSRHAVWGDYDNDGYLDLFVAAGPSLACRLYRNLGDGNFLELKNTAPAEAHSQCPSWADYDNDGALDLFVATAGEGRNRLYHNNGNTNHWAKVRLKGMKSNSFGVGARVFASATIWGQSIRQMRQIASQTLCQELEAHFGLGDATNIGTLRIEWPSGHVTEMHDLAANQILSVQELPAMDCVRDGAGMQMTIIGNVGERYDVKTSPDIAAPDGAWILWQTVTNTSRTMTVTDPSPTAPQRFYKAMPAK